MFRQMFCLIFILCLLSKAQAVESTLFTTQIPVGLGNDRQYELGTRFSPVVQGFITKARIYTTVNEGGLHTVRLWQRTSSTYTLIAGPINWDIQAGVAGWKENIFQTPVAVSANTEYILSVSNSSDFNYAKSEGFFSSPLNNEYLTTFQGSGVYSIQLGTVPTNSYNNSCYFRDIVFVPSSIPPNAPIVNNQSFCMIADVAQLSGTVSSDCVIDWFSTQTGGTPLSLTTNVGNGTYYAESRSLLTGLVSVTRTAAVVTISANPDLPVVVNQSFNRSATANDLVGVAPQNCIVDWFTSETGGTPLSGSTVLTTRTYFAGSRNVTSGCTSISRVPFTVTINLPPAAPTVVSQVFCGYGTIANLSGEAPAGCVIDWYSVQSGGTALVPSTELITGTYYAESRNITSGVTSTLRSSASISINPLPAAPVSSNQNFYYSGNVSDLIGTVSAGCVIDWYRTSNGGSAENATAGLVTGQYFAEARNVSTACVSSSRTPVMVTIEVTPTDLYSIYEQVKPDTFGNDGQYELGTRFSVRSNGSITKVRIFAVANESGNHTIRLWKRVNGIYVISSGPHVWDITPRDTGSWRVYDLPAPVIANSGDEYIISVSNSNNFYYPKTNNYFTNSISNQFLTVSAGAGVYSTSLGGVPTSVYMNSSYFRDVVFVPRVSLAPDVPVVNEQVLCGNSTVASLLGTPPQNCTIDWFTSPSGGNALTATTLLNSGTYYAQSRNIYTGLVSDRRVAANVIVNSLPGIPDVLPQTFLTLATVADLRGTPPSGSVIEWFNVALGGNALASTVPLTTGIYFAGSRVILTGCRSDIRVSVQVTVPNNPDPPLVNDQTFCGSATISNLTGTAPDGCVIDWYIAPAGGVALSGNTSLSSGIYYAESRLSSTNQISSTRSPARVIINSSPVPPVVFNQTFYVNSNVTIANLFVTPPQGCIIDWYSSAAGGAPISTSVLLTNATTYYAESRNLNTGCVSNSRSPSLVTFVPRNQGYSIMSNQTPAGYGNDNRYELGTRFSLNSDGIITKVKIYTSSSESGDHTVRIWSYSGSNYHLISGPFNWNITAGVSGWKEYNLPSPVNVSRGTEYIVSVSNSQDNIYPSLPNFFQNAVTNQYINTYPGSGVYSLNMGTVPTASYNNACYFRDIVFIPDTSYVPQLDTLDLPDTASNSMLVLVNSSSDDYSSYFENVKSFLDHLGMPYYPVDLAQYQLPDLSRFGVVVLAHNNVFSSNYPISQIQEVVSNGAGLICFDQNFFDNQSVFTTPQISRSVSSSDIIINQYQPAHYISKYHVPDPVYNPDNDKVRLLQNITISENSRLTNGVVICSGYNSTNPQNTVTLLEVSSFGNGKIVKWNSSLWMRNEHLGFVSGMDDLLWRSIVWAAKKPFIMQGLPPFVTMRVDDVDGVYGVSENFEWVNICNNFGLKPWLGTFNDGIPQSYIPTLRSLLVNSNATAFPHSFTRNDFIYRNHLDLENFNPVANTERALSFFRDNNLPLSNYLVPHYYELNQDVLPLVKNAGCDFLGIQMYPGLSYGANWINCAPYRIYATGYSGGNRPVYYGGNITVNGLNFFNCLTEIRDDAGYEWAPDNDVIASSGRGIRQSRRSLNSMVLTSLFTHENDYIDYIYPENWVEQIRNITSNLTEYNPIYTTTDYAIRYIQAKTNIKLENVIVRSSVIELSVTGANNMPTKCYLYNENNGVITDLLIDIPAINGTATVNIQR